jgi:hypothetical protein
MEILRYLACRYAPRNASDEDVKELALRLERSGIQ